MGYFWGALATLFIFGCPAVYGIVRQWFKHKERMQEKRNEELRLQIQLKRAHHEYFEEQRGSFSSEPLPRDASWNEHVQSTYETGYQQQQIRQQ